MSDRRKKLGPRREINWYKPRRCWRKTYRGATYYIPNAGGKKDAASKEAALAWWRSEKEKIDQQQPRPTEQAPPEGQTPYAEVEKIIKNIAAYIKQAPDPDNDPKVAEMLRLATAAVEKLGRGEASLVQVLTTETGLARLIQAYLAVRRQEADAGQISVKTYAESTQKLAILEAFAVAHGASTIQEAANEAFLERFRSEQLRQVADGETSKVTAKKRLSNVSMFLHWCHGRKSIPQLPASIEGRNEFTRLDTNKNKPSPMFFSTDEIRSLYTVASQRVRLYIALGLNCAYTQIDVSTLTHPMLDLEAGYIRRLRHKTSARQEHRLWPLTVQLLRAEITSSTTKYALLTPSGKPLMTDTITDKGTHSGYDAIRKAFDATMKAAGIVTTGRGYRTLRKTAADQIERFDAEVTGLFLGHTEKQMKRHYVQQHFERLDRAVEHLETVFHLADIPDRNKT